MKKLLLALLVSLGLQTQAQINYCDSIEINLVSSSAWCNLETNISSLGIQGTVTYDWTLVDPTMTWNWAGWDSTSTPNFWLQSNTTTTNVNPLYYNDTLLICLTVMVWNNNGTILLNCYNSCEDTLFWDGVQWNLSSQQTQIPITCNSITTTYLNITPNTIDVTTNSMSLGVQFPMHSWDLYEGGWNGQLTYSDTTVNATIPLPSPNLVDTFVLCNWSDYGAAPYSCYSCDTFAWNNGNWNLLSIMQQPNYCDSLSYNINANFQNQIPFEVQGNINNFSDAVNWNWAVCGGGLCYSGYSIDDNTASFPQISYYDTVQVCYTASVVNNNMIDTICESCDYYIFDFTTTDSWVLFNMNNPTSINELTFNEINDNKIYDMLGRELNEIPVGIMYIRNKRLYITN